MKRQQHAAPPWGRGCRYDRYEHGIQRADAMRVFFLHKFGGIYIDLDIECRRSLDFLRHYPWVMPQARLLAAAVPGFASKSTRV